MIRVLLVDDSPSVLAALRRMLEQPKTGIVVVGTARNGADALDMIPSCNPQVICTDLNMSVMDGLAFTREVMARYPRPILIVSLLVQEGRQMEPKVFQALEAGAVDIFPKPRGPRDFEPSQSAAEALVRKIRVLAGVHVFTRRAPRRDVPVPPRGTVPPQLIAIGASTGGPQALLNVLEKLPSPYPIPIMVVQHLSAGYTRLFAEWLGTRCHLPVVIAAQGEMTTPNTVYVAPEAFHLGVDASRRISLGTGRIDDLHRPSVSHLFSSVARHYGTRAMGILLTGMGRDGADGLLQIRKAGGTTIAQAEEDCVVFGMPQQAIALGAAQQVLNLDQIAALLIALSGRGAPT